MSREIKFRVKQQLTFLQDDNQYEWTYFTVFGGAPSACKDDTLGQYTGLKDANGVEVYEGDIVHFLSWENPEPCEVFWCAKYLQWYLRFPDQIRDGLLGDPLIADCTIIGNIHENPELLEVAK